MPIWLQHAGVIWWSDVLINTTRYAAFALVTWAMLWVVLKIPLRGRKIRPQNPSARQMAVEFACSLRSIAEFATAAAAMSLMARVGLYPLAHLARVWGTPWLWTSLVLMILGHDAYFYWTHRAMHLPRLFLAFHGRHHLSRNPSPFTAYSFDLREAAVMASFVVLWPLAVPTPLAGDPALHPAPDRAQHPAAQRLRADARDRRRAADVRLADHHHPP